MKRLLLALATLVAAGVLAPTSATAPAFADVIEKSGLTARARVSKSSTDVHSSKR
jgi:hypothetical protein